MTEDDALITMKAMSDHSRLGILRTLKGGPLAVEQIAEALALAPSTASFHLKKLAAAGLVASRRDQYYTVYSLAPGALARTLDEIVGDDAADRPARREREDRDRRRALATFFAGGRLLKMPAQKRKRTFVLERFAALFDEDRPYPEREVDELIRPVYPDYCLVRRLLVDEGYLSRADQVYTRTHPARADDRRAPGMDSRKGTTVDERKRALRQQYKLEGRTAGVFRVRNLVTGAVFLGSALDINGPLNRIRFQLEHGSYRDRTLQADFDRYGGEAFAFEIVARVEPAGRTPAEIERELEKEEAAWAATLDPANTYNTSERLRFP